MPFLIRYNDGSYNLGPEGSPVNGFPVGLAEASRYSTREVAEARAQDLANEDGSAVEVIEDAQLPAGDLTDPVTDHQVLRWLHANLQWDGHGHWLPELCIAERQAAGQDVPVPSYQEFRALLATWMRNGTSLRG